MAPWSPSGPYVSTTPMLSLRPSTTLSRMVYRRFFTPKKELTDDELAQLTDVDFSRVVALLVTKQIGEGEVLMGGGRYAAAMAVWGKQSSRSSLAATIGVSALRLAYCGISCGLLKIWAWHTSRRMCSRKTSRCLLSFGEAACRCSLGATEMFCT